VLAASEPQRQEQDIVKAFSSVMHSLPMGVFSLDKAGNVIVWNKTAENKLDKMQEAVWQGTIFNNVDIPHQKKDGTLINLSLFLSPLKDSDNNITGTIGFFFHPSISYKGEETDFSALTKLEYLKMVYHELRIPLVSLMGWILRLVIS
jgi:PAS domain-containing protein